jgi:hypothetical protein
MWRRLVRCVLYCIPALVGAASFFFARRAGMAAHRTLKIFLIVMAAELASISAIMFFQEFTKPKNVSTKSSMRKERGTGGGSAE